ncbi:MAG: hypothetical protein J4F98_16215 [Acidobacteria bacterium]|nr:hypothetical protein [Acidobacteriota bacterium]
MRASWQRGRVCLGQGLRDVRRGRTIFIDGLDEVRAGSRDGRTALDRVRARLDQLGRPPFRLSCREADWLGRNDLERLTAVAPESEIKALRLDPLTSDDATRIARADERLDDAERFLREAEEKGLGGRASTRSFRRSPGVDSGPPVVWRRSS